MSLETFTFKIHVHEKHISPSLGFQLLHSAIYLFLRKQKHKTHFFSPQNGFLFLSAKTNILTRNIFLSILRATLPAMLQMWNAGNATTKSFSLMSNQQNNKGRSNRQAGVCTSEYWSLDIKQTDKQINTAIFLN